MRRPRSSTSACRGEDEVILHPHLPTRHLHHKANSIGSGHAGFDKEFFAQVMNAVSDAGEILIIGPAGAKTELAKYLREQHPKIGERIVAVEAADHPSDREIVAYAKQHFKIGESAPSGLTAASARHERDLVGGSREPLSNMRIFNYRDTCPARWAGRTVSKRRLRRGLDQ